VTSPSGRSALFGPPPDTDAENDATAHSGAGGESGRRALFSAPPRRRGTVVVECSRCDARTPVPVLDLGRRLVLSVWLPLRTHSHLMLCPACRHPAWTQVQWRTVVG
jgi:hypothetical protein